MPTVYLVRHGQASFGEADYDALSPLGYRQSQRLGQWLAQCGVPPGFVATGDMRRHRETAVGCLSAWGVDRPSLWQHRGFNEFDHEAVVAKAFPALSTPEAMRAHLAGAEHPHRAFQALFAEAMGRWVANQHPDDYPESFEQFKVRVLQALAALTQAASGDGDVWLFTSGGPVACIVQAALGLSDAAMLELNWSLTNTGVTQIFVGASRMRTGYLNAIGHLQSAEGEGWISYR